MSGFGLSRENHLMKEQTKHRTEADVRAHRDQFSVADDEGEPVEFTIMIKQTTVEKEFSEQIRKEKKKRK
jgi:hypothetical protein